MKVIDMFGRRLDLRNLAKASCGGLTILLSTTPSFAVSCLVSPAKLSSTAIENFTSNPSSLLNSSSEAGIQISNTTRALAASDSETLGVILDTSKSASSDQRSAIGTGLARAAQACVEEYPEYAAEIQEALAELGDTVMAAAFEAASEDFATAAIDGADGVVTPGDGTGDGGGAVDTTNAEGGSSGGNSGDGNGGSEASTSSSFSAPSFSGSTDETGAAAAVASPST